MPVNNGVITGNGIDGFNIVTIGGVIGSVQLSGTNLIAQALIGGTLVWNGMDYKSAFKLVETHGTNASGEIIAGAKPYFAVFSSKAPGVWVLAGPTSARKLNYKLKNYNPVGTGKAYWADLSHFDGYDNKANIGPNITGYCEYNANNQKLTIAIDRVNGGSFDWNELKNTSNHQSTTLDLYIGVRVTIPLSVGTRVIDYFSSTPYNKVTNPYYEFQTVTLDNIASKPGNPVVAQFILGEGTGKTACIVADNAAHLAEFTKSIPISESASVRLVFGINAAKTQVEVSAYRVGGNTLQAISVGGNFIGKVNGVSEGRIILNSTFSLTMPVGSTLSNKVYAPVTISFENLADNDLLEITGVVTSNPSNVPILIDSLTFYK